MTNTVTAEKPMKPVVYLRKTGVYTALSEYTCLSNEDKADLRRMAAQEMEALGIPIAAED